MPRPKIDIMQLNRMLRSGKSVKQCAKFFNVSPSAISQAKKNLNVSVVKNVALENAHRVVDKILNAIDQLQKINSQANELLENAMRIIRGDENPSGNLQRDPREVALRAMQEIRGQLKLQLEIFQILYDVKAAEEFQQEVLTAIGEASPEVRDAIISRLGEKRAIRTIIQFD